MIPQPCKIEDFFAEWESDAEYVACASDVDGLRMHDLLALADSESLSLWENLELGYTDPLGHPLLRESITAEYRRTAPDDVTVCGGGAVEALFLLANALLSPGDHAIVIWPAFESLHRTVPATGATFTAVPLVAADNWRLDLDAVRDAIQPRTRALFLNFPHNPTGALPTRQEFEALVALATEAGITVVSDEVYRHLEHDPADTLPAACDLSDKAVSVGVVSKAYALAGLRIGWLATRDKGLSDTIRSFKNYTTVCPSAPAEILSLMALRARDHLIARSKSIISENLAVADAFFRRHRGTFAWHPPRAGMIAFPRLLLPVPVEDFTTALARKKGVLLLPDRIFDTDDNRFRVGLGRTSLPQALERLDDYLTEEQPGLGT